MFTPIDPEVVRLMKKGGLIKFFVFDGWDFVAMHNLFTTVPHKIVYVKRGEWDNHQRIFDCSMTLSRISLVLEKIAMFNIVPMSKATEYMFLEMTLEGAEKMARLSDKTRLVVSSKLTTFAEVASEQNFMVRQSKFEEYFRATKKLEYEKKGTHGNE